MLILGPVSALFEYLTFAFLWYGLHAGPAVFQTGWFLESPLSQSLVEHVIRTARSPLAGSMASAPLCATTLLLSWHNWPNPCWRRYKSDETGQCRGAGKG